MRNSILVGCLLVACGGGDGGGPAGPTGGNPNPGGQAATSATVQMRTALDVYGYAGASSFDPGSVTIQAGGTVTWTNSSTEIHNVTFVGASGVPANIANLPSGSAARTFATAGMFHYSCTNHVGMSGSVVVQ